MNLQEWFNEEEKISIEDKRLIELIISLGLKEEDLPIWKLFDK